MKKIENGTITNVKGIKATGISAGLKNSGKKDLALIYSEGKAVCAGVFTKNLAKAAPILIDMEHIKNEVWYLLGFLLQQRVHESKFVDVAGGC